MSSMKRVMVGFFNVPGVGPDSVETPIVGNPKQEYAALQKLIERKHRLPNIRRIGSVVETRDAENPGYLEIHPGATLAQLFLAKHAANVEQARRIGSAFIAGHPFFLFLILSRAEGRVIVEARGALSGSGNIRFPNKISANRLASELPMMVEEVLGSEARNIKLNLREVAPKTQPEV